MKGVIVEDIQMSSHFFSGHSFSFTDGEKGPEVATVSFVWYEDSCDHKIYGLMFSMFVIKEFRGRGLGTRLVEAVITRARAYKCKTLTAVFGGNQKEMCALCHKFDFDEQGRLTLT